MLKAATPLFLIGAPRSGTTILSKLLNAHPRILLSNETAVFMQLNDMIEKSKAGVKSGILFGKTYHQEWANLLTKSAPALIEDYYTQIAQIEKKESLAYWGEKHPHLNLCLPFLTNHYPSAHYIYAIRDPRDSACSIAAMNNVPHRQAIETWNRFAIQYENFADTISAERLSVVRYEDLVRDYEGTVSELLAKLHLNMDEQVRAFIEKNKNRDSHKGGQSMQKKIDFLENSFMRWKRDMSGDDQAFANSLCGDVMRKYGYTADGALAEPRKKANIVIDESETKEKINGSIEFKCNICGAKNQAIAEELNREKRSCTKCGSSVRTRSIIHLLSTALYGKSLPIDEFPSNKQFTGIGLSDWLIYAKKLSKKFNYTNTYFHKKPRFDVANPEDFGFSDLDFLISTEVFEHVVPPVQKAFDGAFSCLKQGGWLVLTVPFMNRLASTTEHFPELNEYKIIDKGNNQYRLDNTTLDGRQQSFDDLRFHGGPGETLEMRIFARHDLVKHLELAGFSEIRIMSEDCPEHGIVWNTSFSLPILAKK